MPSKTEEYLALAQRTANGLTRYWESWTAYLTTAWWMFIVGINSILLSISTLRRTLRGMMQQPAEKPGGKHSFLKTV